MTRKDQPDANGRYYPPVDKEAYDVWVEDDFDNEQRFVVMVIPTWASVEHGYQPGDEHFSHITYHRVLREDDKTMVTHYEGPDGHGWFDMEHALQIVKTELAFWILVGQTPPYPKRESAA